MKDWLCRFTYFDDAPPFTIILPETFTDLWRNKRYKDSTTVDIRDFIEDEKYLACYSLKSDVEFNEKYAKYAKDFPSAEIVEEILREKFCGSELSDGQIEQFSDDLTPSEFTVLVRIAKDIGREGNISIVKCIQNIGYSRPVYDSLLAKLGKYGIAEVRSQGAKGTHIKFNCTLYVIKQSNTYGNVAIKELHMTKEAASAAVAQYQKEQDRYDNHFWYEKIGE